MISVIIPIYNAQKFLERCLNSILNQTYVNFEVLMINDGSKDKSEEICLQFVKKDNRFVLINKDNGGVSSARNKGLSEAKGNYIAFVDADDYVELQYLEVLKNGINNDVQISCCNYFNYKGAKKTKRYDYPNKTIDKTEALDPSSSYYSGMIWAKLFSKNILTNLVFDEEIFYAEDALFLISAIIKCSQITYSNEPLYHYWDNEDGAMKKANLNKLLTAIKARERIVYLYSDFPELVSKAKILLMKSAVDIKLHSVSIKDKGVNKKITRYIRDKLPDFFKMTPPRKEKIKALVASSYLLWKIYRFLFLIKRKR